MALNDELYSRLVNLYQDLDDQQIHKLNARLILLLSEKIPAIAQNISGVAILIVESSKEIISWKLSGITIIPVIL